MTGPTDQRAAVIEAIKQAHEIVSKSPSMSLHKLAQLGRAALALSDLDRGIVGPLTRPAAQKRRGHPKRNSEEVLLAAAARALHTIFAEETKSATAPQDVADTLHVRGYSLGDGSPITANTIRGWKSVKDLRVISLTKILATTPGTPSERARNILRFIARRVTAHPSHPNKSSKKLAS